MREIFRVGKSAEMAQTEVVPLYISEFPYQIAEQNINKMMKLITECPDNDFILCVHNKYFMVTCAV